MKVFTHGSIVNFQESAREMFIGDLNQCIQRYYEGQQQALFGTIYLDKELTVYGHLLKATFGEELCEFEFITSDGEQEVILHPTDTLAISHDAVFDLLDEDNKKVRYDVIYITFQNTEDVNERTYFLAKEGVVSEPLACVSEFWRKVCEVGKDADFNVSGCRTKCYNA